MESVRQIQEQFKKGPLYRFDIFKGVKDKTGKIYKLKSVGAATLSEGSKTYTVYLKTFLNEIFYLLPEEKKLTEADYIILTREPSLVAGKKYFWNNVGEGTILDGENSGYMQLLWDVLGCDDIYMNLCPTNKDIAEASCA